MFKFSLFIAIIAVTLCLGQKTRYDDYKAVRFYGINGTDLESFWDRNIDVWAQNLLGDGWADLMLHKDQIDEILELYPNHKIFLDNVQTEIDRHEAEMQARPPGAKFFDYFPTYSEVSSYLNDIIADNPGVVRSITLGNTFQGNAIRGLHMGTVASNDYVFIQCTIHAREWITTTTCCHIIDQLVGADRSLLGNHNYLIVPVLNIDGYQYTHSSDRMWRKNRQTNSGSSCIGTDLNRNYQIGFGGPGSSNNPCSDTFRGTSYFSGPETAGQANFFQSYSGRIVAFFDIHAYGGMFMSPWGNTYTLPPDYPRMNTLMVAATNAIYDINGRTYAYGSSANVIYLAAGGSDDWAYGGEGIIPSFSIECFGNSFTPPTSQILPVAREIWAGLKAVIAMN